MEKSIPNDTARYPAMPTAPDASFLTDEEREVFNGIKEHVSSSTALDERLDLVFELSRRVIPTDRLGLALVEEDGERLVLHWAKALYEPLYLKPGFVIESGEGLRPVLQDMRPRIIDDLGVFTSLHPGSRADLLLHQEGLRSSMAYPLRIGDQVIGLLHRSSRERSAYTERHLRVEHIVMDRLAQAVNSAVQLERLRAANRSYGELLAFISHELKNPLASILGSGEVLLRGYAGEISDPQRRQVESIVQRARHLMGLTREYLDLAHIEHGQLRLRRREDVDFANDVLEPALDTVAWRLEQSSMQLKRLFPRDMPKLSCDPVLMRIVMTNLLSNAAKYGYRSTVIRVEAMVDDELCEISVTNDGPGFGESERDQLFRKFSRLESPELQTRSGTGVGLYTCWRILRLHDASIGAESEPGHWARFWFRLPVGQAQEEMREQGRSSNV